MKKDGPRKSKLSGEDGPEFQRLIRLGMDLLQNFERERRSIETQIARLDPRAQRRPGEPQRRPAETSQPLQDPVPVGSALHARLMTLRAENLRKLAEIKDRLDALGGGGKPPHKPRRPDGSAPAPVRPRKPNLLSGGAVARLDI